MGSAIIPYMGPRASGPGQEIDTPNTAEISETVFKVISSNPISLRNFQEKDESRTNIRNLILHCNNHKCGSYCTKQGTTTCKSFFPLAEKNRTETVRMFDKNKNTSYRVRLRRNQSRLNPCNFSNLEYMESKYGYDCALRQPNLIYCVSNLYTSKVDKGSSINDVPRKIRKCDSDNDIAKQLRTILINMDTCRATGALEAASNLLLYPHRYVSLNILRVDTRGHLPESELEVCLTEQPINDLLYEHTRTNENFSLLLPAMRNSIRKVDKIAVSYCNRPSKVYDLKTECLVSSESMTMVQYIENYVVTKKRKLNLFAQSKDRTGKIVERGDPLGQDFILDLMYWISPPDSNILSWCAGAVALYVPPRYVSHLLSVHGRTLSLQEAYKYYNSLTNIDPVSGSSIPAHADLHEFSKNENDMYHTSFPEKKTFVNSNDGGEIDNQNSGEATTEVLENLDLDPDDYPCTETNAHTNLEKAKFKTLEWLSNRNCNVK